MKTETRNVFRISAFSATSVERDHVPFNFQSTLSLVFLLSLLRIWNTSYTLLYFHLKVATKKETDGLNLLINGSMIGVTGKKIGFFNNGMGYAGPHMLLFRLNSLSSLREESLCSGTSRTHWQSFKPGVMGEGDNIRLDPGNLSDDMQRLERQVLVRFLCQ